MYDLVDAAHARGEYGAGEEGQRVAEAIKTRPRFAPIRSLRQRPDGSALELTTAEFDLLVALAGMPGEVQTREALTLSVFRRPWRAGDRAVDNAVLHLRQKLAPEMGERCIVTIRQVGYVFIGFPNS